MPQPTVTVYAVIQTGCVTPSADPVPFVDSEGNRCPAILFTNAERDRCIRMQKRLLNRFAKMRGFVGSRGQSLQLATPILGVVEIEVNAPSVKKKSKPIEPSANGTTPEATPPTPTVEPAAEPLPAKKRARQAEAYAS